MEDIPRTTPKITFVVSEAMKEIFVQDVQIDWNGKFTPKQKQKYISTIIGDLSVDLEETENPVTAKVIKLLTEMNKKYLC